MTGMLRALAITLAAAAAMETMDYPETKKVNQVDDLHGTRIEDPYRGLEDDHAADTLAWVKAQNAVTSPVRLRN